MLSALLAARGQTQSSVPRASRLGKVLRQDGVPMCDEWQRIDALPRRIWTEQYDRDEVIDVLTREWRTPHGQQTLWYEQAVALCEIADQQGLCGGIRVSGGKTLIVLLAPAVLGCKRPLAVVPAKSINSGKVERARREAAQHWRVHPGLMFIAYDKLGTDAYTDFLDRYQPDGLFLDEAHKGKSESARGVRMDKWIELHPAVPVVVLSGTLMSAHVVQDVAKLSRWALGARSPVPLVKHTVKDWADALEVRKDAERPRMEGGALERWREPGDRPGLDGLRAAYGRRYTQTPGVLVSHGDSPISASLTIDMHLVPKHNDAVTAAFHMLRNRDEPRAPDGWLLVDAPVIWALAQQLALGFYYRADPRPPIEWTLARQAWAAWCRSYIKGEGGGITELQCANLCRAAGDEAPPEWLEWIAIRDTFQLNTVPVWLSDDRLALADKWLRAHPHGLCWTPFRAFGWRMTELYGWRYFGPDAKAADGVSIVDAAAQPCVVSTSSCSEDLNLQDRWHSNLFVCPPASGLMFEQAIARTHRFGQAAAEVTVDAWLSCIENVESIESAQAKEDAVAIVSQDDKRKLLVAEWSAIPHTPIGAGPAWRK